jgi:hypothetical protein
MSRKDDFDKIILEWNDIEELIKNIPPNANGSSAEVNYKIYRSTRTIFFIKELLNSIDINFVPMNSIRMAIDNSAKIKDNLINSINRNNFDYFTNIDIYLDSIIESVMPYSYKNKIVSGLKKSIESYNIYLQEFSGKLLTEINNKLDFLSNAVSMSEEYVNEIREHEKKILTAKAELVTDDNSASKIIELCRNNSTDDYEKIKKFLKDLEDNDNGIIKRIHNCFENIKEYEAESLKTKENSLDINRKLMNIYNTIFLKNENTGRNLEEEISRGIEEFNILKNKITSLLPGATAAGLASVYNRMREEFRKEANFYNRIFYISLGILFVVICFIQSPVGANWLKLFLPTSQLDTSLTYNFIYLFNSLVFKFSFILPVLLLIIFISRKRNEAQRLEQEYAHKESLAESYESYRIQIEKLNSENKEILLQDLLKSMVDAISFNPATTLDKVQKNETPFDKLFDDNSPIAKALSLFNKIKKDSND